MKADGLKRYKGVRLYDDSPKPTSGPLPRSLRDLRRDRGLATVNDSELDSLSYVKTVTIFGPFNYYHTNQNLVNYRNSQIMNQLDLVKRTSQDCQVKARELYIVGSNDNTQLNISDL